MKRYLSMTLAVACLVLATAPAAHAATTSQAKRVVATKITSRYDVHRDPDVRVTCRQRTRTRFECRYHISTFYGYCSPELLIADGYADVYYLSGYSRPSVLIDETENDCV